MEDILAMALDFSRLAIAETRPVDRGTLSVTAIYRPLRQLALRQVHLTLSELYIDVCRTPCSCDRTYTALARDYCPMSHRFNHSDDGSNAVSSSAVSRAVGDGRARASQRQAML